MTAYETAGHLSSSAVVGGVLSLCFSALTTVCTPRDILPRTSDPWTCLTKLKLESKKWADRAFALHLWSMHVGKPEQRINRVKELGYLFVEERPPASCDRLPH